MIRSVIKRAQGAVYRLKRMYLLFPYRIKNWLLNRTAKKYASQVSINLLNDKKDATCLCSIQYELSHKRAPSIKGYLFQTYPKNDGVLYYKKNLDDKATKVADAPFDILKYNISYTPSGYIIATPIAKRGCMYIIKDGKTVELFCNERNIQPCGWLYNTGIDFIVDDKGNECCIYAEYGHFIGDYYVWKGVAPYNKENLWQIVFKQKSEKEIHHFHQLKRDPWTNFLYLTSGDVGNQNKWWISEDLGCTFRLINSAAHCECKPNALRMTHFVFTKDYIYWATDSPSEHSLFRIERSLSDGIIDVSTQVKLTNLPFGQGTNAMCFIEKINALFLFERIGWSETDIYQRFLRGRFNEYLYSINENQLYTIIEISNNNKVWGGHRGKCYQLYDPEGKSIIMGFSQDTPCIMTNISPKYADAGSIVYKLS